MLNERQELINRLKILVRSQKDKKNKLRAENQIGDEVWFLVKEDFVIASLIFKMRQFNISFEEIEED